jgi:hypothetical protein
MEDKKVFYDEFADVTIAMTAKRSFRAEGILAYTGTSAMFIPFDQMASISLAAANSLLKRGGGYNAAFIIANSQDLVQDIMKQICTIYGTSVQTISAKSIIQIVQNLLSMFQLFMQWRIPRTNFKK